MAVKKVRERVHNGGTTGTEADWDTIYKETSEDLLVGQIQSLASSGYKKHPGGLIEQWGTHDFSTGHKDGVIGVTIKLPITFPTKILNVQVTLSHFSEAEKSTITDLSVAGDANTLSQIAIRAIKNGSYLSGHVKCDYRVLGY